MIWPAFLASFGHETSTTFDKIGAAADHRDIIRSVPKKSPKLGATCTSVPEFSKTKQVEAGSPPQDGQEPATLLTNSAVATCTLD